MSKLGKFLTMAGVSLLVFGGGSAAPREGERLETMVGRIRDGAVGFKTSPPAPGFYEDFVRLATGGAPYPVACLTPVAGELRRSQPSPPDTGILFQFLTNRPSLPSGETFPIGEWLTVHYTTDISRPQAIEAWDENDNGVPDLLDRIQWAAERFFNVAIREFRFQAPVAPDRAPIEIFLLPLPDPIRGVTIPGEVKTDSSGTHSMILLDPEKLSRPGNMGSVAHQLAHALQFSYSALLPAWWQEATAVWLEKEVTNDINSHSNSVAARLRSPHISLATDRVDLMPGGYLWPLFLVESHGNDPALIRALWEAAAGPQPGSLLEIFDRILIGSFGDSFRESFLKFAIWNTYTGKKDDGFHYRFGAHLPDPALPPVYDSFPSVARPADTYLEPLGTRLVRLEGRAAKGGLEFHLYGQEGSHLQVNALIFEPEHPDRPYFLEIPLDEMNRGELRLPWDALSQVMIFIQNLDWRNDGENRIGFTALSDPSYPFTLARIGARPEKGQMVLEWSTSNEQDLLGWNLYRSSDPTRGFSPINSLLLPGGGDSHDVTNYLFLDDTVRPGEQVYYYLEGITLAGYGRRSHIIGTRSLPRANTRSPGLLQVPPN